jgi:hypothetical protein
MSLGFMTTISEEASHKKEYWQNELESLGIEPKRQYKLNDDNDELEGLAEIIKQVYYQDYRTAYTTESSSSTSSSQS